MQITKNTYTITNNGNTIGTLKYKAETWYGEPLSAWVLWPESADDGVTYTSDLNETVAIIAGELGAGWVAVRGSSIDLITDAAAVPAWVPGKVLPGKVTYTDGIETIEVIR
ncbi:hypothetical protein EFT87_04040 [Schleiferilactobacillus harbinensis]|uniref:hypothetical protein n=1 Tax=Schleiferilactobacillus harbinensis TaxID=304207 RepID=UPI0021A42695|nr:hypothetical protein [Schleiferilactobacillus harbinensis]MCT2907831.1 hypothetical protein [Schleiferilactobacillus harbinensis]